jgi:hypothetical protein
MAFSPLKLREKVPRSLFGRSFIYSIFGIIGVKFAIIIVVNFTSRKA